VPAVFEYAYEFFSGQSGEPRTGVGGCGRYVARAFQPEHSAAKPCRFCLAERQIAGWLAPSPPTPLPRWGRGEDCMVSGQSGEPRTGVRGCVLYVARAFQPEICPFAFGPSGDRRTGAGFFAGSLSHAKPRSREAAKPRSREVGGGAGAVVECSFPP